MPKSWRALGSEEGWALAIASWRREMEENKWMRNGSWLPCMDAQWKLIAVDQEESCDKVWIEWVPKGFSSGCCRFFWREKEKVGWLNYWHTIEDEVRTINKRYNIKRGQMMNKSIKTSRNTRNRKKLNERWKDDTVNKRIKT